MDPEEALDRFWKCVVDGNRAANEKHGFGGVPFREVRDGVTVMGVRFPDGTEQAYEVGASYRQ